MVHRHQNFANAIRCQPQRAIAFTLVEILVVVAILGFASAMIIPQIGSRNDLKAAAAARIIVADLTYAQSRAIATQRMQYISFDLATTPQTYAILNSTTATDYITDPISKGNFIRSFASGGTAGLDDCSLGVAGTVFDGQTTLAFDSLGQPYAVTGDVAVVMASGAIEVKCGEQSLTITIEPYTGEMTVE